MYKVITVNKKLNLKVKKIKKARKAEKYYFKKIMEREKHGYKIIEIYEKGKLLDSVPQEHLCK